MSEYRSTNSDAYWDFRFSDNWEKNEGPRQSRFFSRLTLANLPAWMLKQIRRDRLTIADWGCAQGDGTNVWASYVDPGQLVGIDFSGVAIEQATKRYPAIRFLAENWLGSTINASQVYDIVFSSNTLEHFHKPYEVLEIVASHATKAVILALPFIEIDRIDEHFFTFLPENIPLELGNGFRLVWSRVVDCSYVPEALWGSNQIFLIYANTEWLKPLMLTLSDCELGQEDTATAICKQGQNLAEHERQIERLEQELEVCHSHMAQQGRDIEARDTLVTHLGQEIAECNVKLAQAQQECAVQTEANRELDKEVFAQRLKIVSIESEMQNYIAITNQIKMSRSWRLTMPLRWLVRLLRRILYSRRN